MYNPYQPPQMPQFNQYPPMRQYSAARQEVVRVNGKGGADAYQMVPNSSALLLDETAPIVWLVTTDGAGFKSAQPYEIKPYKQEEPADVSNLEVRIARLEAVVNEKPNDATINRNTFEKSLDIDTAVSTVQKTNGREGSAGNGYGPSQQRKNE